jgi:iron complex outermembrane receptor protein
MRYAVLIGFYAAASLAQDIVITAPRFPEEVQRLPASVTVITQEDIARSAARTLPELLSAEVGFTTKDLYGNNAALTLADLRGFGATAAQNTLILLDGRRVNDFDLSGVQWAAIPIAAVERVEIVRGSGAVLYGDAATSGIVNIVTRSPLVPGKGLEVMGRTASHQTHEGQLYGAYGGGTLGISGSIYGYESDGYRRNNKNEQQNNTMNLRWALGQGNVDLRLGTDRQDLRLPGGRFVQPSANLDEYSADRRGASTPLDYSSRDGQRAGLSVLQRYGDVELSVGLDRRDKDQRSYFDFGGFPSYRADDLELTSLTPKVRWTLARHTLVAGVDFHDWTYKSRRTDRPENVERPTNRVTVTQETTGWYVQDTYEVVKGTLITAGWRGERARYAGDDEAAPPALGAPSVRETQKQRAWELGLKQQLTAQLSGFLRGGRSFRFVNAEEIYESDINFAPQFQLLRPQHAHTYEGGGEWRAGANAARLALFRMDVRDEIHLDPFTTGVGNTNLPPSRRQGFELEGKTKIFTAGYAYTEAKFREGTLAGSPFAIGTNMPVGGRTVPLVPRHKLNLGAAWDIAARTRLSAAFIGVSSQVMDNDEPNTASHRIPAYYVVDLKLAQRFQWGALAATINNLTDEKYYTYAVRSAFTSDRYSVYPLPERTLGLVVEVKI